MFSRFRNWLGFLLIVQMSMASADLVGTATYYHNNLIGSPVAATSSTGSLLWTTDYLPYGEKYATDTNAANNKVWFAGHVQDAPSGLVYMEARYYDPDAGRFVAVDPVGFNEENSASFNRYSYANGNPISAMDPDGRVVRVVTADPEGAKRLMEAYAKLNKSAHARKINDKLEKSSDVYEIRQITRNAFYCPAGTTHPACGGKTRAVFVDPYKNRWGQTRLIFEFV